MQCDEDEPSYEGDIPKHAFEFELGFCTPNKLREEIISEILCYDNEFDDYAPTKRKTRNRSVVSLTGSVNSSLGELNASYISRR